MKPHRDILNTSTDEQIGRYVRCAVEFFDSVQTIDCQTAYNILLLAIKHGYDREQEKGLMDESKDRICV